MCFVPPPFILKQFFDGAISNPLEFILAVKQASFVFISSHSSVKGFANVDATVQAKRFSLWAFAVFKGYIKESSFNIDPDNEELQKHCNKRHAKCIMLYLISVASTQTSMTNQVKILQQLGAGLNQMGEAKKIANTYTKGNMQLKELKVENKKDRVCDLHPSTKHMLKMASATELDQNGELCNTFKSFFNSKNHSAADIQLHQLMEDKGFSDTVFGEGVSMTLWSGNLS
jgi:hypothetical protein